MFCTKVVEEIKTHILHSVTFFFLENHAVYDIKWKNTVVQHRPQTSIWHMHSACWITKATHSLTICNTYCFSIATMVARPRLIVKLYVHFLYGFNCSPSTHILTLVTLKNNASFAVLQSPPHMDRESFTF